MNVVPDLINGTGRDPEALAILTPAGQRLTHGALANAIVECAAGLRRAGIERGDVVATLLPSGPLEVSVFLGVAAAAVAAPIDPALTADELTAELRALSPRALLMAAGHVHPVREVAPRLGLPILELRTNADAGDFSLAAPTALAGAAGTSPLHAEPADVALVLRTSGTTGGAKLVPLTHGNLVASARDIASALQLTPQDRSLVLMPLIHIHGLVGGALAVLGAGGSCVCPGRFDATSVLDWITGSDATWFTAAPTIHAAICNVAGEAGPGPHRLRFVRSASAPMPAPLAARIEETLGVPLVESYGMTEAAPQITSQPLPPGRRPRGSVGPAAGPEVAILDANAAGRFQPALQGVAGEIVIRGDNVMSGYLGAPPGTGFIDGWFRTGDLGVMDDQDYLTIVGRTKEMINRGGEKVAPREVDEVLLASPLVTDALTFPVPHPTLGEDVAAAVVLAPGTDATAAPGEIREFAGAHLAAPKIPRRIVVVQQIPETGGGKRPRDGLADALGLTVAAGDRRRATPPRDAVEWRLHELWAQVLAPDAPFGVDDDFFAVGGDSLSSVILLSQMGEAVGREIDLDHFLSDPTIAGMAEAVRDAVRHDPDPMVQVVRRGSGALPLFFVATRDTNVMAARHLMESIDPGHPIYGLAITQLAGSIPRWQSIHEVAEAMTERIRAVEPDGPYLLAGHSLGGMAALEVARQLDDVALLVLLDTRLRRPPGIRWRFGLWRRRLMEGRAHRGDGGQWAALSYLIDLLQGHDPLPLEVPALFIAADRGHGDDMARHWAQVLRRLDVARVPGGHVSMLQPPDVDAVAEIVAAHVQAIA